MVVHIRHSVIDPGICVTQYLKQYLRVTLSSSKMMETCRNVGGQLDVIMGILGAGELYTGTE